MKDNESHSLEIFIVSIIFTAFWSAIIFSTEKYANINLHIILTIFILFMIMISYVSLIEQKREMMKKIEYYRDMYSELAMKAGFIEQQTEYNKKILESIKENMKNGNSN